VVELLAREPPDAERLPVDEHEREHAGAVGCLKLSAMLRFDGNDVELEVTTVGASAELASSVLAVVAAGRDKESDRRCR